MLPPLPLPERFSAESALPGSIVKLPLVTNIMAQALLELEPVSLQLTVP